MTFYQLKGILNVIVKDIYENLFLQAIQTRHWWQVTLLSHQSDKHLSLHSPPPPLYNSVPPLYKRKGNNLHL